jgi:hypothetical protein
MENKIALYMQKLRRRTKKTKLAGRLKWFIEDELIFGEKGKALTLIIPTKGCRYARNGGCTMCGYIYDASSAQFFENFKKIVKNTPTDCIKLYTSGSFFDRSEISLEMQEKILEFLNTLPRLKKIIIESCPTFITRKLVDKLKSYNKYIEIAIGLESSSDKVLKYFINKPFKFENYVSSAKIIKSAKLGLKTYLLFKPPFISEKEAISDILGSVEAIKDLTDTIGINLLNVQKGTLVDILWKRNLYRPPWLWSLIYVLTSLNLKNQIALGLTGAGTPRGAQNCRKCTTKILKKLRVFALTQNIDEIQDIYCECKKKWDVFVELNMF